MCYRNIDVLQVCYDTNYEFTAQGVARPGEAADPICAWHGGPVLSGVFLGPVHSAVVGGPYDTPRTVGTIITPYRGPITGGAVTEFGCILTFPFQFPPDNV